MERHPSDQGQREAVTITGLSPAIRGQRGQREEGARRPLTAQVGGIEAPSAHGGPRERVTPRESALSTWAAGVQARTGGGLPTAGAVLAPAGSAGKSVSSPICSSFPSSSRTGAHRGLPSQHCEPSAFPRTRGPAAQGSVSPASGRRSSRLGGSEGLQTHQAWLDSSCVLSVPGGQGLILQLHQAWQEEPYQGCRGNGPQTNPDRLSEVPPPRPTEEEEALSPGATGLPSFTPAPPPPPRPHAPCQSLGLAVQRRRRQEGQHCPLPGARVLWGRRANTEEGTRSDTAATGTAPWGRGVV